MVFSGIIRDRYDKFFALFISMGCSLITFKVDIFFGQAINYEGNSKRKGSLCMKSWLCASGTLSDIMHSAYRAKTRCLEVAVTFTDAHAIVVSMCQLAFG
jgi:hypothetical protein